MPAPLLTAQDATGHVHLVIGSNPLANARCSKSLEVGATVVVLAQSQAEVHYALQKKVNEGKIDLKCRAFEDSDLTTLGREEVDRVVDSVFVTIGKKALLST